MAVHIKKESCAHQGKFYKRGHEVPLVHCLLTSLISFMPRKTECFSYYLLVLNIVKKTVLESTLFTDSMEITSSLLACLAFLTNVILVKPEMSTFFLSDC